MELAKHWGIDESLWRREWASLSGGEGQRIALAIGVSLRPDVLLLDGEFDLSALPCQTTR